jgi:hypothetical protein
MRPRLLAIPALCSLAAWGCVRADIEPDIDGAFVEGNDGEAGTRDGGASPTDGGAARDLADARPADTRDAPVARDGGGGDLRLDGPPDSGPDAPAPSCSDNSMNSDETDKDCGGHCGKCAAGLRCLIGADCIFGLCKNDHTCGQCLVAADCTGIETECTHRLCTLGVCGVLRQPTGMPLAVQTSGDCQSRQCAADGTPIVVNDSSDLPDDQNPCTNDFCMAGASSHTPLPLNSSCGGLNKCNATGQCVGCVAARDCPGTDTACQTRTCSTTGICGFSFQPTGTRLTDTTTGDCKSAQCDGKGAIQVVNDDSDKPVDNNACTTDECSAGTPAHRPIASGIACGTGLVCDGANRCVMCLSASTCAGTDTECHTRTCLNGTCGISNKPAGTVTVAQTAKDCKRSQCDGAGEITNVADSSDPPVDGNVCTADTCTGLVASNPPLASGTNCGGTQVCDGQGVCVGCVTASTCTGTDTECHTRTCVNRTCGVSNTAAGTLLFSQTSGDCQRSQCDGAGNTQVVNDANDVLVDGNPCSADLCTNGVPSNPFLPSGTVCGSGQLCNEVGACVGCRTAADCAGTDTACQVRTCLPGGQCGVTNVAAGVVLNTQVPGDCKRDQCDGLGHVVTVSDDTDRPVDNNDCTMDLCVQGFPSNPPQPLDTACAQGMGTRCNGLSGAAAACVQCNSPSQCPGDADTECHTRTCSASGTCGISLAGAGTALTAQLAGDCKRAQCDNAGNAVLVADATDPPVDGNGCTRDVCTGSTPSNPPESVRTPCAEGGGALCDGHGVCAQCLVPSDCPSDGPDTVCRTRTCVAGLCDVSLGVAGTPLPIQILGDCHRDQCDNAGGTVSVIDNNDVFFDGNACTSDVCAGGVNSNPPVQSGTSCAQNGGLLCDGAGTCAQCLTDAQCDSSHDGPCNKNRCSNGACTFVPEPVSPPNTDLAAGDCQRSVCDGTGNVMSMPDDNDLPANSNVCQSLSCTGGQIVTVNLPATTMCTADGRFCDGAGNCP